MEFEGQKYVEIDSYGLFDFIEMSHKGECMRYFDKYIYNSGNGIKACYVDDINNSWEI